MSTLTREDVDRARLASLLIDGAANPGRTALSIVEHFLAMQAQDAAGVAWSLALRNDATETRTATALAGRDVVRTWPMRGTLHLIPSRDAKWMLELMGGKAIAGAARRRAMLGLDDDLAFRAVDVLAERVARADGPVTRKECLAALVEANISPDGQRGYHLLWLASQLGQIAGGPPQGKEQTFVSLETWPPAHRSPSREEALALVAGAYVRGHGPVAERELMRWTGLGLHDSHVGLTLVAGVRTVETEYGQAWIAGVSFDSPAIAPTRLLPGFDEFMLGYPAAQRAIDPHYHHAVVPGNNGVFKPTVIDCGRVVALWTRTLMAKTVRVRITPLGTLDAPSRRRIGDAAELYAAYLERPLQLTWADS